MGGRLLEHSIPTSLKTCSLGSSCQLQLHISFSTFLSFTELAFYLSCVAFLKICWYSCSYLGDCIFVFVCLIARKQRLERDPSNNSRVIYEPEKRRCIRKYVFVSISDHQWPESEEELKNLWASDKAPHDPWDWPAKVNELRKNRPQATLLFSIICTVYSALAMTFLRDNNKKMHSSWT